MASTYTTSVISVFGNMRVRAGVLHLNDGAANINFDGMRTVYACLVSPCSVATTAILKPVTINSSAAGYCDFGTYASGDALNFLVMGI